MTTLLLCRVIRSSNDRNDNLPLHDWKSKTMGKTSCGFKAMPSPGAIPPRFDFSPYAYLAAANIVFHYNSKPQSNRGNLTDSCSKHLKSRKPIFLSAAIPEGENDGHCSPGYSAAGRRQRPARCRIQEPNSGPLPWSVNVPPQRSGSEESTFSRAL